MKLVELIPLRDALADLYPHEDDARRVVEDAGMRAGYIRFSGSAVNLWQAVLREALRRQAVDRVARVALADYPDHPILKRALAGLPMDRARGRDIEYVEWRPVPEAVIGSQSSILPVAYLEVGLVRARSVAMIRTGGKPNGTGWLVAPGWLITNQHVLPCAATAARSDALFGYQMDASGVLDSGTPYTLDPEHGFACDASLDYAVVRVSGDPHKKWGTISTFREQPVQPGEPLAIIQHPGGGPKAVALGPNSVTYADQEIVQYLTDTLPGASGSPVFDRDWNMVAIHHSGGWCRQPHTDRTAYRNQGTASPALRHALSTLGIL